MLLSYLDWAIILSCLTFVMVVGFAVSKISSKDSTSFFLANRNMPWWLLGLSMVATTFSADTPNLVTDIVRNHGVAGNWTWMCLLITGMLTTFIYAKLWRRLGVATDNEFYEGRYSGNSARLLRGFRALYLGFFFNVMVMASISLAAIKIGSVLLDFEPIVVLLLIGVITVVFSVSGGFLGVLITDAFLFVLAMAGSLLAAYYSLQHEAVGGISGLISHPNVVDKLSFLPDFSDRNQLITLLVIPFAVQWWSVWYPGAEPGGGGYVAQRMLAAKDEHHAVAASAFFNFCHYAIRPWPWIIVALTSLIVFPDLESLGAAFPNLPKELLKDDVAYSAMLSFIPAGAIGIVIASLMAAFVSTISTQLNWGASYLVHDVFQRFIHPAATGKEQVLAGRVITVVLMVCSTTLAFYLESALQAFRLLLTVGAGTGLLFLLRWFWMRINVWSEISAMVVSFITALFFELGPIENLEPWERLVYGVGITTACWVGVTLLTKPDDQEVLNDFKQVTHCGKGHIKTGAIIAVLAIIATYATLISTGLFLYGETLTSILVAVVSATSIIACVKLYQKQL